MNRPLFFGTAAVVLALSLAACGGNGGTSLTPAPTCVLPSTVQMIYPVPGATAVPDNPQQFVFAESAYLPASWNAYVNNSNTLNGAIPTAATVQNITASQVPQGAATPNPSLGGTPVYQSISLLNGFTSAQTIYVWLNDTSSGCSPTGPVGSFTTQ
ncbi:MAG: hypothetical protein ACYDGM_04600 [Vulcanimicrobiaceae bacterium]